MDAPSVPLSTLPPAWRQLLVFLKKRGEARAEDLAAHLGITLSGVRQHLAILERDGLVRHRELRQGPGRPKYLYALTEAADALFPRTYATLTNELLEYVADEAPDHVERLFVRRAERRIQHARVRLQGRSFEERVAELAHILDEDGYLADWERRPDGSFLITEHNCAVLGVAQRFGFACTSELAFLRAVLPESRVERVAHMLGGQHVCAYEIRAVNTSPGIPR